MYDSSASCYDVVHMYITGERWWHCPDGCKSRGTYSNSESSAWSWSISRLSRQGEDKELCTRLTSLHHNDVMVLSLQNGQSPLHHASVGGHVDTVTVLLERKAKVDLQNEVSGETDTPVP